MDTSENALEPTPSSILFARGVIARLAIWTTLRIAIQENWGGPHGPAKRTWLASTIVDAFQEQCEQPPDDQYIEEMLLQVMADEFDTIVEDGSAESVAEDVVRLWGETQAGKTVLLLKFEELAEKTKGKRPNAQEKLVSDDEADDMDSWEDDDDEGVDDAEPPQLLDRSGSSTFSRESQVDEDGFTLVQSKKRK
jgi:pre-rRNA-processing protein TSR2